MELYYMEFGNKESCLAHISLMREKCRKRYDELYSSYQASLDGLTEEEKKIKEQQIKAFIKCQIDGELGCFYL